jgi:hypothetical protein
MKEYTQMFSSAEDNYTFDKMFKEKSFTVVLLLE